MALPARPVRWGLLARRGFREYKAMLGLLVPLGLRELRAVSVLRELRDHQDRKVMLALLVRLALLARRAMWGRRVRLGLRVLPAVLVLLALLVLLELIQRFLGLRVRLVPLALPGLVARLVRLVRVVPLVAAAIQRQSATALLRASRSLTTWEPVM